MSFSRGAIPWPFVCGPMGDAAPLQDYYEVLGVAKAGRVWGCDGLRVVWHSTMGSLEKMGKMG